MLEVVRCARSCEHDADEIRMIATCSKVGCGKTAFEACMRFERKKLAQAKEAEESPRDEQREKRTEACRAACAHMRECAAELAEEGCVERCVAGKGDRRTRAVLRCAEETCEDYAECALRAMGVARKQVDRCGAACLHEVSCRPPGKEHGLEAVVQCTRRCDYEEAERRAIEECAPRGCGRAFQRCVLERTGKLAERKALVSQCEALCKRQDACEAGTGRACVRRCVEAGGKGEEVAARQACAGAEGCDAWSSCLLEHVGIRGRYLKFVPACRFELRCAARGTRGGDLLALRKCTRTARWSDEELDDREYCQVAYQCGSGFAACMEERAKKRAARRREAQAEGAAREARKRCETLCRRALECEDPTAGDQAACEARCTDPENAREFEARQRCGSRTCGEYTACVLGELGLAPGDRRCVARCAKEASGKGAVDPFVVVACATRCADDEAHVRAARRCVAVACGAAYDACIRKEIAAPTRSPAEKACMALCEQVERCTPGLGGAKCVSRCLSPEGRDEFAARRACRTQTECAAYDACMMRQLEGAEEPETQGGEPAKPDQPKGGAGDAEETPARAPAKADPSPEEPAAKPAKEPAAKPAEEPKGEPAKEPAAEPAEEPAKEPAKEPAAKPAEEPKGEPAKEPAAKPAEEPATDSPEPGGGAPDDG